MRMDEFSVFFTIFVFNFLVLLIGPAPFWMRLKKSYHKILICFFLWKVNFTSQIDGEFVHLKSKFTKVVGEFIHLKVSCIGGLVTWKLVFQKKLSENSSIWKLFFQKKLLEDSFIWKWVFLKKLSENSSNWNVSFSEKVVGEFIHFKVNFSEKKS